MKWNTCGLGLLLLMGLAVNGQAGKGYMGGSGTLSSPDTAGEATITPTITDAAPPTDGPLNDNMSDSGKLFGDLYVIARYKGGETKMVPAVDEKGLPILIEVDWIDPDGNHGTVLKQEWASAFAIGGEPKLSENFAVYTVVNEDTGALEINPATGGTYFLAPYPSQCVQPVADVDRWGDIFEKTGLDENRLPLVITYDPTWQRTECAVEDAVFLTSGETWNDIIYYKEIRYPDLIQEVDFGRLNLGRAPDAVLDHAFDEAIRSLNSADSIALDASGRLLLTTKVYDEFLTDPEGSPVLLETVIKAIDSPLENLALYIKLMKDGHLITPAAERTAIDRSLNGGIPLSQLAEIEDGPSKVLRPTINIEHMKDMGLGNLVDASNITTYYTYYNSVGELVISELPCDGCEKSEGIITQLPSDLCKDADFPFSATFFASAADKSGKINVDKVVYLNSILGINLVVGYSAYDTNGEPVPGAIDYSKNPVYYNYGTYMSTYDRGYTFTHRGQIVTTPGLGNPATYDGKVRVLVENASQAGNWNETVLPIFPTIFGNVPFSGGNIAGFTTMADDDLRTINYIHTYQIPGLR